jgi:N-glycosylase/DNA lyase
MKATQVGSDLVLEECEFLDIPKTFESGQAFRFTSRDNGASGVVNGRVLDVDQEDGAVILRDVTMGEYDAFFKGYFALDVDYQDVIAKIDTDVVMHAAIEAGSGIRVLRQDAWEALVSFTLSQNNNIPRIKGMVEALCTRLGSPLRGKGTGDPTGLRAFPTPIQIADAGLAGLSQLRLGYRDAYIHGLARAVLDGGLDLVALAQAPTIEARETLISQKGVGGKVADCVLLFGLARYEACPHDVWIKRVFGERYGLGRVTEKNGYAFATGKWGPYAGIAQQFLFYAERKVQSKKAAT